MYKQLKTHTMKIKVFNIDYLFELDEKYRKDFVNDNLDSGLSPREIVSNQLHYLNTIREVVVELEDQDILWINIYGADELLLDRVTDETGEYISKFSYKVLPD